MLWTGLILVFAVVGASVWQITKFQRRSEIDNQKYRDAMVRNIELDNLISVMRADQERKQAALSRCLHDDVGADLAAVKLMIQGLSRNLHDLDFDFALRATQTIDSVMNTTRNLSIDLSPASLKKGGLDVALKEFCDRMDNPKIQSVKFQTFGEKREVSSDDALVLYRSVKELVNNAYKHSLAWHVYVETHWNDKKLKIVVMDDGLGARPNAINQSGMGHKLIEGSLDTIRASLLIDPKPNKYQAVIWYPLRYAN